LNSNYTQDDVSKILEALHAIKLNEQNPPTAKPQPLYRLFPTNRWYDNQEEAWQFDAVELMGKRIFRRQGWSLSTWHWVVREWTIEIYRVNELEQLAAEADTRQNNKKEKLKMSTNYKTREDVPTDVICNRLKELSNFVTLGREAVAREFTMRVPAELDYDADLVLSTAAGRLGHAERRMRELEAELLIWREGGVTEELLRRHDGCLKVGRGCVIRLASEISVA